jgi:hypothetical protein
MKQTKIQKQEYSSLSIQTVLRYYTHILFYRVPPLIKQRMYKIININLNSLNHEKKINFSNFICISGF